MSESILKMAAISTILGLALIGTLIFIAIRRGWMRNRYFTTATTILIVLGIYIGFQGLGSVIIVSTVGLKSLNESNIVVLAINGIAQLVVMLGVTVLISLGTGQDYKTVFRLRGVRTTPALAYILALPIMFAAQAAGEAVATLWTKLLSLAP